jgi:hypothetical protein
MITVTAFGFFVAAFFYNIVVVINLSLIFFFITNIKILYSLTKMFNNIINQRSIILIVLLTLRLY